MRRRTAVRTAFLAVVTGVVVTVRRRRRDTAGGPASSPLPVDPAREAAAADTDASRVVVDRGAPAAAAMSPDPEAPEGDALAQAQDVDGELVPHEAVGDDRPVADALDQAAVVDDDGEDDR